MHADMENAAEARTRRHRFHRLDGLLQSRRARPQLRHGLHQSLPPRRPQDHARRLAAGPHGLAHRPLPDPARWPEARLQGLSRHSRHEAGRGLPRRGLHQGLAGQGARQRRCRHRPAVRGAEARGREARRQAGPGDPDPRPVHPPRPGSAAEGARHLPVDVPDAHVLLGRLVQADRRPGAGRADLADALDPEHRPARDQPHRRAGGAAQPDAGRVGHGESHLALGRRSSAPTSASRPTRR